MVSFCGENQDTLKTLCVVERTAGTGCGPDVTRNKHLCNNLFPPRGPAFSNILSLYSQGWTGFRVWVPWPNSSTCAFSPKLPANLVCCYFSFINSGILTKATKVLWSKTGTRVRVFELPFAESTFLARGLLALGFSGWFYPGKVVWSADTVLGSAAESRMSRPALSLLLLWSSQGFHHP